MKIISKFKDFYDHKVAKYGIDPVLVFDRRQSPDAEIPHGLPEPPAGWEKEYGACAAMSALYVGRLRVYLFNTGVRVYTSFDVAEVIRRQPYPGRDICPKIRFHDGGEYCLPQYGDYLLGANENFQAETVASREELPAAPLLLECETGLRSWREGRFVYYANPQLSALGIYIDPDIVGNSFAHTSRSSKTRPKPARACPTKTTSATKASMPSIRSGRK